MSPRRILAGAALALALAGAAPADGATRPAPACQEDESCWNWRTMGDHRRGLTTIGGVFKVVDARHFDALNRASRIDWARSGRMRGDF